MHKNRPYNSAALCALGASLAGSVACPAAASEPWNTALTGDVAPGYRFWPSDEGDFRLESEAGYHGDGGTHYLIYMSDPYYDFHFSQQEKWQIEPYMGGGAGDAGVHLGDNDAFGRFSSHDGAFAYQGMEGLAFASSDMPNAEWSMGYRYLCDDSTGAADNAWFQQPDRINARNVEFAARFYAFLFLAIKTRNGTMYEE